MHAIESTQADGHDKMGFQHIHLPVPCPDPEGGGGQGSPPPPPQENHKKNPEIFKASIQRWAIIGTPANAI